MQYAWLNASMQQGFHNPIDEAICESYESDTDVYTIKSEIPYDFIRKRLTTVVNDGKNNLAITKGALNNILEVCSKAENAHGKIVDMASYKEKIARQYESLSHAGFRTLGIAYKLIGEEKFGRDDENNMIFLGFITLFDPPKPGVKETIANLRTQGVLLKIITGDNALVAKSLAAQIGIESPNIITGGELKQMRVAAIRHRA